MPPAKRLRGKPVAAEIRETVRGRVRELDERGVAPTLGTVLMSDDPADERFMQLKHAACDDVGIGIHGCRLDPNASEARLHDAIEEMSDDPRVDAVFVQVPLPDHVQLAGVRRRIDPRKDVDCFHPTNLGRLVAGDPRFVPATPAAVRSLLTAYDIPVEGRDVAIVGRSSTIGRPLANLLMQKSEGGNATVTVCHSRTRNLGSVLRRADVVVSACGVPNLITGSMLSRGVVVVDVSANRRRGADGEIEVVGDVESDAARQVAAAVTPVPGGVGPVTVAKLLENVVLAAERRTNSRCVSTGDDSG